MIGYVYQIEVRNNRRSRWKIYDFMISPPGYAVRHVLDCVNEGQESNVRVKRVLEYQRFINYVMNGFKFSVHEESIGADLVFNDAILPNKNLGNFYEN
jgi:hypothetical protein